MTAARGDGADAAPLLRKVAARLAQQPARVRPVLELVADPDALPAAGDGAGEAARVARHANAQRVAALTNVFIAASLSTDDVRARLGGISRQAVSERVRSGRLLGAVLGGVLRMPSWQFDSDGVAPRLGEVLDALRERRDGAGADAGAARRGVLAVEAAMRAPIDEEGGRSAADLFVDGDVDLALHYLRAAAP